MKKIIKCRKCKNDILINKVEAWFWQGVVYNINVKDGKIEYVDNIDTIDEIEPIFICPFCYGKIAESEEEFLKIIK